MNVPFLDLRALNLRHQSDFEQVQRNVLRSGCLLFGNEVAAFEREFAQFCGRRYCVLVANGLDALSLSLRAWINLGRLAPGDEVVVPANSFVASALAVRQAGLRVRFADVDPLTHNLSLATLHDALSTCVRAVMPVHLYGRLAELDELLMFCRDRHLLLLEDAAQAHGAYVSSPRIRPFGDAAGFSFYPSKNLGALADAGCVVTEDEDLARTVRALGNYGAHRKYEHLFEGTNSRTDELNAGFLRIKLSRLDEDNATRRAIAEQYLGQISNSFVTLPKAPEHSHSHVWHLFVVEVADREGLTAHLTQCGVESSVHYPCAIHKQPAFAAENAEIRLPVAERLQDRVLSLPISPVMSCDQVQWVIDSVNSWHSHRRVSTEIP